MARAETIESVGDAGGGGNSPLPRHSSCRMELPRAFHTWPSLISTTAITTGSGTGTGAIRLHHNHHHLPPLHVLHPLPYPHSEGQDELQSHQQSPSPAPPASLSCDQRENRGGHAVAPSAFSEEQSDLEREEHQEAFSRRGPLPDLLPQNEHSPRPSPHHRDPRGEALQDLEVRRVGHQLRVIGDEFNATVLRRARAAPHWRDWRDACRGLFNFITQTLSTLYRLT